MNLRGDFQFVVAIDFGTTYTGYAYSTRHEFHTDPLKINLMTWNAGSGGLVSQKAPTCVLFKPDETFHSFGYQAEDHYNELAMDGEHRSWFFFRRFKMHLYQTHIDRKQMLTTEDGKKMPAIKVVSSVISHLKNHAMKVITDSVEAISETDIRWVVTVPAIWTDPAKQMMREAAEMAGLAANQLLLVLEPEAASILCQNTPVSLLLSRDRAAKIETFHEGCRYMVLDAGGGTIDITVHEVLKDGFLKEIYEANGGDWGGIKVDASFEKLLETIVGKPAFDHFKTNDVPSVIDLHRNFEVKKRNLIVNDPTSKSTITVPYPLMESFRLFNPGKGLPEAIPYSFSPEHVEWNRDKIRLSQFITRALFQSSLTSITKHVSYILGQPQVSNCEAILMVGGYSECQFLQEAIRRIAGHRRLIIPSGAGLAVLKGAVINGHCPGTLSQRICKYTYGIDVRKPFGVDGYDKYRIVDDDGEVKCEHCFEIFVSKGSHVLLEESSVTKTFNISDSSATGMCLMLYASTSECPKYVTDDSCQKIGQVILNMSDTTLGKERGANVTLYFGGSEIQLTAVDKDTENKICACFDFLG